jgi:hypothetical protein
VHDDTAGQFFADMCRQSDLGNSDIVSRAIAHYFRPERIRYFITSAIGFYISRGERRFKDQSYQNVTLDGAGQFRIRGAVHPINVLEPLLWLGHSLATTVD